MRRIPLTILLFLTAISIYAQKTYVYCGKMIDVNSETMLSEITIVIDGDRIEKVKSGYLPALDNGVIIDLKNKVVMPGLIDMHVHLEGEMSKKSYIERFTLDDADVAFQSKVFAERNLMAGFTTVRDLGGRGVNTSLRDAINKGLVIGPRVYSAGKSLAVTGGHADPTNGWRADLMGDPGPAEGVVNGVAACRKGVRQRYKNGADLIKITATAGVLSMAKSSSNPQFTEEEIRAIVETAADFGMKVAAHAHGAEGMKRAIRAGVASIEHGTLMDDDVISLMKKKGTFLVPTIIAGKSVTDSAKIKDYYPEMVTPKALEIGPKIQASFGRAYAAGVKIAFGTDAGVYKHGMNGLEFQYMVEAGMPPMETIMAATINAAELLGASEILGSLEPGKFADIIAVDQDPLEHIETMQNVSFVMKGGVVYKK
ncbi:MAG: amidohydrolase family protein [Flavobacteriales bacterium]|nr:amidohydrolase family protein [Flavobacteriales bacterium]MBL4736256.1 amidohydrolase family protein [Flavobacteriales bacterium]